MKTILLVAAFMLITGTVRAQPVLDSTTCGSGATLASGSRPAAGSFVNDVTTQAPAPWPNCRITIAGIIPRRCSAMREADLTNPFAYPQPTGCQVVINATNSTLTIGPTSSTGDGNETFSYESSTY